MRLFVWDNDDQKFAGEDNFEDSFNTGTLYSFAGRYTSGSHSGGLVVIAPDLDAAVTLVVDALKELGPNRDKPFQEEEMRRYLTANAIEKAIEPGIVYHGDGDC